MSPFKKVKNFDSTANVLSYAYFQVCTVLPCWLTIVTHSSTLSIQTLFGLVQPLKYNASNFQAFKFPDSMNVHFQCVVQVMNKIIKDECSTVDLIDQLDARKTA